MQYFNMPLEQVNINVAISAYKEYYKTHKFEKNEYTQYYKRFLKWSRQYAGSDGKIHLPTAEEDAERQRRALSFRKSASRAIIGRLQDLIKLMIRME